MNSDQAKRMGVELTRTAIFKDYEDAFHELTHLPLHYIPVGNKENVDGITHHDNPFCKHMLNDDAVCGTCAMMHERLREHSNDAPYTAQCFAGLTETAVPVKLGEEVIGYLQTGQVLLALPETEDLESVTRSLLEFGVALQEDEIQSLYLNNRVISPKQYEAVVRMLEIFANHLSTIINQSALDLSESEKEPERVSMARTYINEHLDQHITLPKVADAVNTSSFYFSRMFKQVTGHTFTEYLSIARIERAKTLMRDYNKNITQIAYDSGFQSLSQFNRVFRKVQNEAPGSYRKRMKLQANSNTDQ